MSDLLAGVLHDPHAFLGMHMGDDREAAGKRVPTVRVFAPGAEEVVLLEEGGRRSKIVLEKGHDAGLFVAEATGRRSIFPYRLQFTTAGFTWEQGDPYRYLPTLGDQDIYFIGEGTHRRLYEVLGAHVREVDGMQGVAFAVWAPSARGVSLIGSFNGWNRRAHPMRVLGASGIWELFVPGLAAGEHYKYAVRGADGVEQEKADPLGFASELRPKSASIVTRLRGYEWSDAEWMSHRAQQDPYSTPMSVYEVHAGSWRKTWDGDWQNYRELADQLVPYVRDLGYTHIELMPLEEHPYDGSWGYQVTGFYAPTGRFGSPDHLRYFVDTAHRAGVGVLMDWVPAHFAIDAYGLLRFDGTFLYEHEDVRRRFQPDWGTFAFNYGRNEVRNFLVSNALYWIKEFHLDGLRVDGVSSMLYLDYSRPVGEWTPNKFGGREHLEAIELLREVNEAVYNEGDGALTIAEESTAWPGVSRPTYAGGLGFGFKWNMGWMHDTLDYLHKDPVYRRHHQGMLTFSLVYAFNENFVLALSHDEVVHGKGSLLNKMPGDDWQKFANLRLLHAYQHAQPGKKLIFMGDEFGQRKEWDHDGQLEWDLLAEAPHAGVHSLVRDLNALYAAEPALHQLDHDPDGFSWLDFGDAENSVLSFARHSRNRRDYIVCVFNLTPVPHTGYRVPVPETTAFREVMNTDAAAYGGSGMGNLGWAYGEPVLHNQHPHSMTVTLPPLAAVFFKPERS